MSLKNRVGSMATYHPKLGEIPDEHNIIVDNLKTSAEVLPHEVGS
jgi:hypothetical protein